MKTNGWTICRTIGLLLSTANLCPGADIYVSPAGSDANVGSQSSPVATFQKAKTLAESHAGEESVTVHVADGVYYLPQTLVFTPNESGTSDAPIVYQAENEGGAVLSGGSRLNLNWRRYRDGIYVAKTHPGLTIDQLFVDGSSQRMARYPNFDPRKKTDAYQGFAADAFSKQRAAGWSNPSGGYIHAMHRARWGGYHYKITGRDDRGEVTYEGGWQNNRQMGMHKDFRMVENIFEELDAPGEWFHDSEQQSLYYLPEIGVDLDKATVEVVRLRHLIEFRGSEDSPVKFVTLKGFVVRHAARTFMDTKEPLLRSDWAIYRGGAFFLTGTEDVQVLDTEFDQVGGNAVFASNYNRRLLVKGCHIHDAGASGVCFVGDPDAVRDPLFEYREKNDLSAIDRTPGPRTNNYPADSFVEDCLIHGIGRVERQPAGVQIAMARRITVRDCSVYDCARAGINIGDGAWGGHLIEGCDVFETVLETHDHGSFNSWGRDRYWRSDQPASQAEIDKDPELPFLDAVETTVIRNSRWRCDHGWDIDLDDGSSNYDIYNNLLLSGGLKLREGFRRRAWNNITVNNGLHPHVWYNASGDEVFGNIFMAAARGARMPTATAKGKRVDGNLYFGSDEIKDRYAQFGWELNSIVGDPQFIDPASGDFRVAETSPAFEIGFRNFPMDQFGVKKASLQMIARTPVIPSLETAIEPNVTTASEALMDIFWLGAELHQLQGEEFSAFGVTKEDGGVALSKVHANSDAAQAGLAANDLIQSLNGSTVSGTNGLLDAYASVGDRPLRLGIIRNQKSMELTVENAPYLMIESSDTADGFKRLMISPALMESAPNNSATKTTIAANKSTRNDPLSTLVDGRLADGYGPVFANGTINGAYRMDLGTSQSISSIASWSTNKNGDRGPQKLSIYGSNATNDPGFDFDDRSRFTPITSVDTTRMPKVLFSGVSIRSRPGSAIGRFRWIVWRVTPVAPHGGNTSFQEFQVR